MAMIELPPYAPEGQSLVSSDTPCLTGRVSQVRDWFVETPVVLALSDGVVVAAQAGETASLPQRGNAPIPPPVAETATSSIVATPQAAAEGAPLEELD